MVNLMAQISKSNSFWLHLQRKFSRCKLYKALARLQQATWQSQLKAVTNLEFLDLDINTSMQANLILACCYVDAFSLNNAVNWYAFPIVLIYSVYKMAAQLQWLQMPCKALSPLAQEDWRTTYSSRVVTRAGPVKSDVLGSRRNALNRMLETSVIGERAGHSLAWLREREGGTSDRWKSVSHT